MELSCKCVSNGLHPYLWQPVIAHWDANKLIINSIQLLDQLGSLVIGSWVSNRAQLIGILRFRCLSLIGKPSINSVNISILISKKIRVLTNSCLPTTYIRVRRGCTFDNVTQNNAIKMTSHKLWMNVEHWSWALIDDTITLKWSDSSMSYQLNTHLAC